MTPAFDAVYALLKQLPGLGHRSAERIGLHLLVSKPDQGAALIKALESALRMLGSCQTCGNVSEGPFCDICQDETRDSSVITIIESIPDLLAIERSQVYKGLYHVLNGKLSPLHNIGPEKLNLTSLAKRLEQGLVDEIILALPNDIEGEATCHYLQQTLLLPPLKVSRIGFGLPTGSALSYADSTTLRSALGARRPLSFS